MSNEQPPTHSPDMAGTRSVPLRWMLPLMAVLMGVALFVWLSRPRPPVVAPEPTPTPKAAADVQKQIDQVKANTGIPEREKGRILGFLQAELEQAKARERGEKIPLGGPNPTAPGG